MATLRGVTFTQSTQQMPKPPGIGHPEAEHHQALAALGCSSLAQGCSRSQKRDKDPTPAPHTLLPQGHLPKPQNIVTLGTKHPASSRGSVPGIVKPEHKAAQEETDSGAPGKPGETQQQGGVSMGSTKPGVVQQSPALHAQEESLGQKQELPLMPLSSS